MVSCAGASGPRQDTGRQACAWRTEQGDGKEPKVSGGDDDGGGLLFVACKSEEDRITCIVNL